MVTCNDTDPESNGFFTPKNNVLIFTQSRGKKDILHDLLGFSLVYDIPSLQILSPGKSQTFYIEIRDNQGPFKEALIQNVGKRKTSSRNKDGWALTNRKFKHYMKQVTWWQILNLYHP